MELCEKCDERPATKTLWDKSKICDRCFDAEAEAVAIQAVREAGAREGRRR